MGQAKLFTVKMGGGENKYYIIFTHILDPVSQGSLEHLSSPFKVQVYHCHYVPQCVSCTQISITIVTARTGVNHMP